jgi:hypothetical protein
MPDRVTASGVRVELVEFGDEAGGEDPTVAGLALNDRGDLRKATAAGRADDATLCSRGTSGLACLASAPTAKQRGAGKTEGSNACPLQDGPATEALDLC